VFETLSDTVRRYVKPEIINSDQGSQFTSEEHVSLFKGLETVRISMDGKGRAINNVIVEQFFRTMKYEKLYIEVPEVAADAYRMRTEFIAYYNCRRDHSSLGKRPPMSVYKQAA
jgi:putative transposase